LIKLKGGGGSGKQRVEERRGREGGGEKGEREVWL
jgi:hypothetical protein